MITLIETGIYKNGGFISYKDRKGNKYWRCFKCRSKNSYTLKAKNAYTYGALYIGDINDTTFIIAKGEFIIEPHTDNKLTRTFIKQ